MPTCDVILHNIPDGYGDVSSQLIMAFWQHFFSIVYGDPIHIRLVCGENFLPTPSGNLNLVALQNFVKNFYGDYQLLMRQAYEQLKAERGKSNLLVKGQRDLPENVDFSKITIPNVYIKDTISLDTKPDFVICGANAPIPSYVDPEQLNRAYLFSEYGFERAPYSTPETLSNSYDSEEQESNSGNGYNDEKERLMHERLQTKLTTYSKLTINSRESEYFVLTPLPSIQESVSPRIENIIDKLNSDQYNKTIFMYSRYETQEDVEKALQDLIKDLPKNAKIFLVVAGSENSSSIKNLKKIIKTFMSNNPTVEVDVEYAGFISNNTFNFLLSHQGLDAAFLSGDQSPVAFLHHASNFSRGPKVLYYETLWHKIEFACDLANLDGIVYQNKEETSNTVRHFNFSKKPEFKTGFEESVHNDMASHLNPMFSDIIFDLEMSKDYDKKKFSKKEDKAKGLRTFFKSNIKYLPGFRYDNYSYNVNLCINALRNIEKCDVPTQAIELAQKIKSDLEIIYKSNYSMFRNPHLKIALDKLDVRLLLLEKGNKRPEI